ncbi:hypothetical protein AAHA92_16184 [Salvia divinorum]|uniref:Disease resistance N-terminal domain-containing protein n=1 Tax=Salvia divinorum TaxID=28513 RepID=A0ABD1GV65_SALDI
MAEAFLKVVIDNLRSLIMEEIGPILRVDKEMKKLSSTLTTLQAVLLEVLKRSKSRADPFEIGCRSSTSLLMRSMTFWMSAILMSPKSNTLVTN